MVVAPLWEQGDAVAKTVAVLLLIMSISAWVIILWKTWLFIRVRRDMARASQVFWSAPNLATAQQQLQQVDREAVLLPLVDAALQKTSPGTLESNEPHEALLTRRLRDALHEVLQRLQLGQVLLASIGSTAPFIGLFGTVWGIYHALLGIAHSGAVTIDKVAGPVGEALIMTALGLVVAIPAVLAYNIFNKQVGLSEANLEGFAHDLRAMLLKPVQA